VTDPAPEPAPRVPVLRVVVVTWNPGAELPAFLASLPAATGLPFEVVVADNASSRPPQVPPPARLLETGANLGYGAAANLAARGAEAPWLLIANPDVVAHPGSVDALLEGARRWPAAAALGPAIRTPEGMLYPSARALPSLRRGLGHALLGWCWPSNPWTAAYRRERGTPREGTTGWLSGSFLLVRRTAFEVVGGFDPGYFMYCEDMDLCERLAGAGWQVVYVPSAQVTHEGGRATRQVSRAMLRAHHASMYRYLSAHYPLLRPALRVGLGLRYLAGLAISGLGAGARPTRGVEVLDSSPPAGSASPRP
jgi:N-acetylglucosaminyl-diphospho-decaprenol L-rhamnosyltransferase